VPASVYRPPSHIPYKPHYRVADPPNVAPATLAPGAFTLAATAATSRASAGLAPAAFSFAALTFFRASGGFAPARFLFGASVVTVKPDFNGWLQGRRVRARYLHPR